MKKAFKMKLYDGVKTEYKQRHKQVFPELENQFSLAGVTTYSIWFDKDTNILFGYLDVENEEAWNNIENTKECQDWWKYMEPLMETNKDNSPISVDLECVYQLDV